MATTFKVFAADHFAGGIKTTRGRMALGTACRVLDLARDGYVLSEIVPPRWMIEAARFIRRGRRIPRTCWIHRADKKDAKAARFHRRAVASLIARATA